MAEKFNLRTAGAGDAEFVFRLSNDGLVRRNSADSAEIRWEDHVKWFSRMLTSPDCIFYIVESEGTPIGQVRFNRRERGRCGKNDCVVKTYEQNPSNRWGFARERGKSG